MSPDSLSYIYKAAPVLMKLTPIFVTFIGVVVTATAALVGKLLYDSLTTGRKCKLHTGLSETVVSVDAALGGIRDILGLIRKENTEARRRASKARDSILEKINILDKRVDDHETRLAVIEAGTKCKEIKRLDALLVEDDEMVLHTYEKMLEELGFSCYTARGRDEAEKALKSKPFDLMVIDMYLNGESGLDLFEYTKNAYNGMKHIIYSGNSPSDIPTKISNIFLEKPIKMDKLQNKINEVLAE